MSAPRDEIDEILRERRERGQMPAWYRRRDAVAEFINRMGGQRMSNRTLRRAKFVKVNGDPLLRAAMNEGAITVAAAAELARLPVDAQRECVNDRVLRKAALRILRGAES